MANMAVMQSFLLAFSALFSIVNPIGTAFIFSQVTAERSHAERAALAGRIGFYALLVMLGAIWAGTYVMSLFGVSIAALRIANPTSGRVNGNVTVSTSAEDDSGAAGIRQFLYVDGVLVAKGTGSSMAYNWNSKRAPKGMHTIRATAMDAAGNSTTTSVSVSN